MATRYGQQYYGMFQPAGAPQISGRGQGYGGSGTGGGVGGTSSKGAGKDNIHVVEGRRAIRESLSSQLNYVTAEIDKSYKRMNTLLYNSNLNISDEEVAVAYKNLSTQISQLQQLKVALENDAETAKQDKEYFDKEKMMATQNNTMFDYYLIGGQRFDINGMFSRNYQAFNAQENSNDINRIPIITYKHGASLSWINNVFNTGSGYQENVTIDTFMSDLLGQVQSKELADYVFHRVHKSNRMNLMSLTRNLGDYIPNDAWYEFMQFALKEVESNSNSLAAGTDIHTGYKDYYVTGKRISGYLNEIERLESQRDILNDEGRTVEADKISDDINSLQRNANFLYNTEKDTYDAIVGYYKGIGDYTENMKKLEKEYKNAKTVEEKLAIEEKASNIKDQFETNQSSLESTINSGVQMLASEFAIRLIDDKLNYLLDETTQDTFNAVPGGSSDGTEGSGKGTLYGEYRGLTSYGAMELNRNTGGDILQVTVPSAITGVPASSSSIYKVTESFETNVPTSYLDNVSTYSAIPLDLAKLNGTIVGYQGLLWLPTITENGGILINDINGGIREVTMSDKDFNIVRNGLMFQSLEALNRSIGNVSIDENGIKLNANSITDINAIDIFKYTKIDHTKYHLKYTDIELEKDEELSNEYNYQYKFSDEFKKLMGDHYSDSDTSIQAFLAATNVLDLDNGVIVRDTNKFEVPRRFEENPFGAKNIKGNELLEYYFNNGELTKYPVYKKGGRYFLNPWYVSNIEYSEQQYTYAKIKIPSAKFNEINDGEYDNVMKYIPEFAKEYVDFYGKSARKEVIKKMLGNYEFDTDGNYIVTLLVPAGVVGSPGDKHFTSPQSHKEVSKIKRAKQAEQYRDRLLQDNYNAPSYSSQFKN